MDWICKKCGGTERYKSGHCKKCRKTRDIANALSLKEYNAQYRKDNREKRRVYSETYNQEHREQQRIYYSGLEGKWCSYRCSAKKRGISFELTKEEFGHLIEGSCTYHGGSGGGIDRIDSTMGYSVNNCCSCCYYCNIAKNDRSLEEFLSWARDLVNFQEKKEE